MAKALPLTVGTKVRLSDYDPNESGGLDKVRAEAELAKNLEALDAISYRLYAEGKRALLLVLQGMDTSGKDGVVRRVMTAFNPQTCAVHSFKQPSAEELAHDFLWRISRVVPRKGNIAIFNRSHYEDVLIVRVHKLVPKAEWKSRYDRINRFERLLADGGTTVVKVYLHIDRDEQKKRLQSRLSDPTKRWKFNRQDLEERKLWRDYQQAYEVALTECNTKYAPWYIVPANRKWYRNLVISRILLDKLRALDPQFPPAEQGLEKLLVD